MYSKTANKGTFFQSEQQKGFSTEKCIVGNFSQRVKDNRAESGYVYENWNVRLVGVACGKAVSLPLENKAFIVLKEWSVRNPFNKERGRNEPYILVTDFDIVTDEQSGTQDTSNTNATATFNPNDFVDIGDYEDVPFN